MLNPTNHGWNRVEKSSVHGYLPYIKGNYNLPEVTLDAEYSRVYRKRISVCEWLRREIDSPDAEEYLWDAIVAYVDYSFITEKGLSLKYAVQGGEIFFNRKRRVWPEQLWWKRFIGLDSSSMRRALSVDPKSWEFWRKLYLPSISSDWRVRKEIRENFWKRVLKRI